MASSLFLLFNDYISYSCQLWILILYSGFASSHSGVRSPHTPHFPLRFRVGLLFDETRVRPVSFPDPVFPLPSSVSFRIPTWHLRLSHTLSFSF